MGKQINYYMTYNDFREIAQYAIDSGCIILKKVNETLVHSNVTDIVTPDENSYYFYVPEAGKLDIEIKNGEEFISGYRSSGNVVIEAGFSIVNHKSKRISRARLYTVTGYYDETGNWVSRPECVKKVYDKLVRRVKKVAPYTEITDMVTSIAERDYNKAKEWKHKEYISKELLMLKMESGYKLGL